MVGGYAVSGRGPLWTRIVAGIVNLAGIAVTFLAPKPYPDLSVTTPHGAWFDTLAASLGVTLALACSIPMRRPDTGSHNPTGPTSIADMSDHRPNPSTSVVGESARPIENEGHAMTTHQAVVRPTPLTGTTTAIFVRTRTDRRRTGRRDRIR